MTSLSQADVAELRELLQQREAGDELAGYKALRKFIKCWPAIEWLAAQSLEREAEVRREDEAFTEAQVEAARAAICALSDCGGPDDGSQQCPCWRDARAALTAAAQTREPMARCEEINQSNPEARIATLTQASPKRGR